jgi:hypothetical protein
MALAKVLHPIHLSGLLGSSTVEVCPDIKRLEEIAVLLLTVSLLLKLDV